MGICKAQSSAPTIASSGLHYSCFPPADKNTGLCYALDESLAAATGKVSFDTYKVSFDTYYTLHYAMRWMKASPHNTWLGRAMTVRP